MEDDRLEQRLIDEIASGRRRLQDLPRELGARRAAEIRRRGLAARHGIELEHLGRYSLDAERVSARHCENLVGVAQIPIGVAGPLAVRGEQVDPDEELFVPLATTEGALVASVSRGCRALREAGGAVVRVEDVGMTRAPVFRAAGVEETREFIGWVYAHEEELRRTAEASSRFLKLVEIRHQVIGRSIYLRFRFHSGDAMGMNMATIACDRMVKELIEPQTGVPCVALSGNFCVDKKPSAVNFLEGRGKRVFAEVVLDGRVLANTLKTTARRLVEVQYRKNLLGSIAAGAMAFNAHYANVLSAFFIATGQDVAQVVEGAMGVTCVEPRGPEGVYASVFLPDLPLGAVGGGTALETQREALALLGVEADAARPGAAVRRLAEIVGAAVLAGELSLLSAFTSSDLASAHERLGRGPLPGGE
ncbi:MAG: hydroxymethylglutaryl-CoA reductase (NADPH) [Thermoanaerobaculia bacterium]|nr:hydroxymethylglutaryl-CoA reductase (NADPH) [Thermoanaerobaculia bacterium]